MFRLNRLTDYAVVVMSQMSLRGENLRSAQQIADDTAVPLPTVSKLLNLLGRAGLVTSQRGATGGYTLSRSPEQISVAQIIQALEGPIALTACVDGAAESCDVQSLCPMRGNWNKVNTAIQDALTSVSLAEMSAFPATFGLSQTTAPKTVQADRKS
ncbi:SUF system Fe-S cluster assembly regulator [Pelagibius litoralis]|uniref:SUF system Fe-S cluster assembly regulator n=1 Tax=Pelagibius litoralis TaxID=374515 RepID=A0A967C622_9PROT|nr:SUF system Fe-S cluster assembly regulator [Pelagibius litoralis]NIA67227.1 SUF system Fe-S cluster assembly regulator [Pelagibius litoralis]